MPIEMSDMLMFICSQFLLYDITSSPQTTKYQDMRTQQRTAWTTRMIGLKKYAVVTDAIWYEMRENADDYWQTMRKRRKRQPTTPSGSARTAQTKRVGSGT